MKPWPAGDNRRARCQLHRDQGCCEGNPTHGLGVLKDFIRDAFAVLLVSQSNTRHNWIVHREEQLRNVVVLDSCDYVVDNMAISNDGTNIQQAASVENEEREIRTYHARDVLVGFPGNIVSRAHHDQCIGRDQTILVAQGSSAPS